MSCLRRTLAFLLLLLASSSLLASAPAIDPKSDGTYTSGAWTYTYTLIAKGTRSEGYRGALTYGGRAVPEPVALNDYMRTPWGTMYWVGNPSTLFVGHGWVLRALSGQPKGHEVEPPVPSARLIVKVKVLAAERGAPPEEEWIRQELKAMQVPEGVGSGSQWITLGKEPVKILDSKHFGHVSLALPNPEGTSPFLIEISGSHPATHELPRIDGTRRIIPYTLPTAIAAMDFYFAFQVEEAPAE